VYTSHTETLVGTNITVEDQIAPQSAPTQLVKPNAWPFDSLEPLKGEVLALTGNWSSSQVTGTEVSTFSPIAHWIGNSKNYSLMKLYKNFTFDSIKVKLVLTSAPTNSGSLRVAWHAVKLPLDLFQMSQIDNAVIYAADPVTFECEIPFRSPDWAIALDSPGDAYTQFSIFVDSPLSNAAGGVISSTWSVYLTCVNPRPYDHLYTPARGQYTPPVTSGGATPAWTLLAAAHGKEQDSKSIDGIVDGVATDVKKVLGLGPKISSTFSETVSTVAGALGSVASAASFFLDKPLSLQATQPIIPRVGTHLPSVSGLDPSVSLSNAQDYRDAVAPEVFGPEVDESNYLAIAKKFSLLTLASIPNTATIGYKFLELPVNPCISLYDVAVPTKILETNCGWVANQFTYWRGSIRYRLRFPQDCFTKMTIMAMLVNATNTTPAYSTVATGTLRTETWKIEKPGTLDITIPFGTEFEWFVRNNSTQTSGGLACDWKIAFFAIGPPVSAGVQVSVPVSVEIAVGDDFEVNSLDNGPISYATAQGGGFAGGVSSMPVGKVNQQKITSVREALRRYTKTNAIDMTLDPWQRDSDTIRRMNKFAFWRGDRRTTYYIIKNNGLPFVWTAELELPGGRIPLSYPATSLSQGGSAGALLNISTISPEVCVSLPFYSVKRYLKTPRLYSLVINNDCAKVRTTPLGGGTYDFYSAWISVGDDFMLSCLLPSPIYYL
jgi:hypothetical protein